MSFDDKYLEELFSKLAIWGVESKQGLSDHEVERVETQFGFYFPPDLRQFLQYRLPVSPRLINWREESSDDINKRLNWPADGVCFDIEHNNFWLLDWGPRPHDLQDAILIARGEIAKAPAMIPIYSHRYIPAEPSSEGNPIFSIYQTDIIYYGYDFADYFLNEYKVNSDNLSYYTIPIRPNGATSHHPIRFWDILVAINGG